MSYTPYTWQSGDTVTAARLNNIEQGVANAGGVLVVNAVISDDSVYLDKTYNEIKSAIIDGKLIGILRAFEEDDYYFETIQSVSIDNSNYCVITAESIYKSESPDGVLTLFEE